MSQSKANYELMRNDNNTFAVRGEWDGGGSEVTVDTALDGTSTNPVENKAIVSALNNKEPKSVLGAFDNGQPVVDTNTIYAIENNVIIRNAGGAYMPMIRLANTAYYAGFDSTAKKATYIVFNKANDVWTPTLTTYYIQERLSGETGYDATKVQGLINNQGDLAWRDVSYTYPTALIGSSGTITSATALISAIQNKTPITFTINGTTATFTHVLTATGESDYMCAYLDGNVVTHIMHLNPDTENNQVAWTSVIISVPSPDHTSDGGKALVASTSTDGEYTLVTISGVPSITITASQVVTVGTDEVEVQLTQAQYNVLSSNKQVLIDLTELSQPSVVWNYTGEDNSYLSFGFSDGIGTKSYRITVDKQLLLANYVYTNVELAINQVGTNISADEGLLVAMDSSGKGTVTNSLPILTTAPSSANTDGIKIVVLSSEPATKYSGYLYIVTGS